MSTDLWRMTTLAAALAALTLTGGCIFVNAQFTLDPDGTQHARVEAGMLEGVGEEEGDFTAQMGDSLAEGKWQALEDEMRGQWRVKTLVGEAGPGESLFAPDAQPQPEFASTTHLLSTEFSFAMPLPEGAEMGPVTVTQEDGAAADEAPADEGEGGVQLEGMDQALEGMMTMMMSSGEAGLHFSARLPGEIVETNGTIVTADRARWSIPLTGPPPEMAAMSAISRLLNWPSVGRLGGELTAAGRWDLVPALIAGVRRGVVPDPVVADPTAAALNVTMYIQALEILTALDAAVGPEISTDIMRTLGLGGTDVDAARVAAIAERLEGMDLSAETDAEVTRWLLGRLGGN